MNSESSFSSSCHTLILVYTAWRGRSALNRTGKKIPNPACSVKIMNIPTGGNFRDGTGRFRKIRVPNFWDDTMITEILTCLILGTRKLLSAWYLCLHRLLHTLRTDCQRLTLPPHLTTTVDTTYYEVVLIACHDTS